MINNITFWIAVLLGIAIFIVPRKYFLVPYILAACFVPRDQRIIIFDLDFTVLRILIVAGILRIIMRDERRNIKWNAFDKLLLAWAVCGAVIYVVQWADMRSVIFKSGVLLDILGSYWLFRQALYSWNDFKFLIYVFAVCMVILAPLVALEWVTGKNPFVVLGKVYTDVREGRFRCQGPFPISILMGIFCATLTPLFTGMAWTGQKKLLHWVAAGASVFLVAASASSTPAGTLLIVLMILCLFKWRYYVRHAAVALMLTLVYLHIVMKAPVWHLISRVDLIAGSTGWHRYNIINQAIIHWYEWILIGARNPADWGYLTGDITNQYILEGVQGGILTLGLFVAMLVVAFRTLSLYFQKSPIYEVQILTWCLFVSMVGHCVAFVGVSYFGQIQMLWYLTLSIIGFLAGSDFIN